MLILLLKVIHYNTRLKEKSNISFCSVNAGPLPNTLEDFWRMIWENRLSTIVMLTQCFEGKVRVNLYTHSDVEELSLPIWYLVEKM